MNNSQSLLCGCFVCRLFSIVLVAILLVTGCDPTISPIKENNLHYSVFGYLDASADTQFVRIEKLRDSLFTDSPANLDIDVRLTNLSTSQQVTMQDSLFRYSQGRAHNYFTTMDIIHNDRYRLEVIAGQPPVRKFLFREAIPSQKF